MLKFKFIFLMAALVPPLSLAIDRDYFGNLKPETAESVLMSFCADAYYVNGERSGNLIVSIERKPYTSAAYKHAILLFLDKDDAMGFVARELKTAPERLGIGATNLNRMLVAQYKTLGRAISEDRGKPDFVIVDTLLPTIRLVEAFVDDQQRPYVHEIDGRKFIPAFFSHDDATAFEETVRKSGMGKYSRRALDFRSHLNFVESLVQSDTPVITFSHDVSKFMSYYVSRGGKCS